ncbi:MAG: hypothetical protein NC041_09700 [Bacteroides sp.]|nr:hypothetical protein [Prevotella sp.]MCM1408561.1 hypothetical protein [Treponema brennaborense]MCM1470725.1 hypothetical protein [Bacteroides sp.]
MEKNYKDILSTFINLAWRLVSGPLSLLLIPLYLSPEQQGYWYLFGSIATMSTFADLGFSNIILQFSAHGFAFLSIKEKLLAGEEKYIQQLGSFFRFVVKWLSLMCLLVYPLIFLVGIFFFQRDSVLDIYWIPWIIYSAGSLINFFNNSVLSFIEGLNQIDKIQNSRFIVAVINTLVIIVGLIYKLNIYALAFAMIFSSSFMFITIFVTFGKIIKQLWYESRDFFYPWRKEIFPLFQKYVLSFASGYFLFQIYTPLMHYFHGPVLSGKVGITVSLVTAMFSFSNIWIYTITPKINILIEKKNWNILDKLFHKRLLLSLLSYILICICFVLFVVIFGKYRLPAKVLERFLPYKAMLLLVVSYFLQLIVNSWAVYLRGHKQEPFWWTSIISAIWVFLITLFAGKFLPPMLFFIGLLTSYFWGIPLSYCIFYRNKNKWHR